jgi:hypothetical protein
MNRSLRVRSKAWFSWKGDTRRSRNGQVGKCIAVRKELRVRIVIRY